MCFLYIWYPKEQRLSTSYREMGCQGGVSNTHNNARSIYCEVWEVEGSAKTVIPNGANHTKIWLILIFLDTTSALGHAQTGGNPKWCHWRQICIVITHVTILIYPTVFPIKQPCILYLKASFNSIFQFLYPFLKKAVPNVSQMLISWLHVTRCLAFQVHPSCFLED